MAGLADFSADDVMTSDDTGPNSVTLAGPGSFKVADGSEAPQAHAQEASREPANQPASDTLDSAAIERLMSVKPAAAAPAEVVEEPVEEPKPEEKKAKLTPAQARIAQLISQREARDAHIAEITAQNVTIQREMQAQQAKFQEAQLALERQRIAMMERARDKEEEAQLSDIEKAKRAFLKEAQDSAKRELSPELKVLQDKLATFEQERETARQAAEQNQRNEYFRQQAQSVLGGVLLKGFEAEEQQSLGPSMEEMLYTFSGAFGVDPMRAAPVFKQFLDKYVKAENSRLARSAGSKVAESRQAPRAVPQARATGGAPRALAGNVSLADLGRGTPDGRTFDNFVQYNAAGRPQLRPA